MAHRTLKTSYSQLADRLNKFPQGAPPFNLLFSILKMLFSEKEAGLVSLLPIKPFSAKKASQVWKMNLNSTQKVLDSLAGRAILIDIEQNGESVYCLPQPMAGFFEFSMMRLRDDLDQKVLDELFHQYMNVEVDFIKSLFTQGETQLGRNFLNEAVLSEENALHVLDYERATEVIKTATHIGVVMAIECGKLQNLIFDNQVLWCHRVLAAVFGVILKLPPVKQILANKQVKSRYLENLINRPDI